MARGDVADLFAAGLTAVRDRQVRTHFDPGVEQAGAKGIQHHALNRHLRLRRDQPGGQWKGGRGRVARHGHASSSQALPALQRHAPAIARGLHAHLGAEGAQHPLGVVAALLRFQHRGDAVRIQPGQQDGRLDLGRGHLLLVVDGLQGSPRQRDRQPVLAGQPAEARAHPAERRRHPLHRPLAQARVAVEGRRQAVSRRGPHQQANAGARITAVDHVPRRREAAPPRHAPAAGAQTLDAGAEGLHGAGGGQDVVALQQPLDLGHALRHAAQDQRAVRDRLVARRTHPTAQGLGSSRGEVRGHGGPA